MGGQACVLYGGAEFSRDTDIAILADRENIKRLETAVTELEAEVIAVPPFNIEYLQRGHAVHFRCHHPEADGMRLDVLSVMRGLPSFDLLWERRTTVEVDDSFSMELLSLPDLVRAKKTQRDKDWPMIRRLLEADYIQHRDNSDMNRVEFWLAEMRTPVVLRELATQYPDHVPHVATRPFLHNISNLNDEQIESELLQEEQRIKREDRQYWEPLRRELEALRHAK